jgi:hypothetical protein
MISFLLSKRKRTRKKNFSTLFVKKYSFLLFLLSKFSELEEISQLTTIGGKSFKNS